MPVISESQGSSWESNVYVIVTTRFFVLMGTAYLIRSLYHLVSATWGSRLASTFASAMSSLGLGEIELDTLPTAPEAVDIEPDLEANLTTSVRFPPRSYYPQEHMPRSQASPRAHGQRMSNTESSIAVNAQPEEDVGVRQGTTHIEESSGLTVELGG